MGKPRDLPGHSPGLLLSLFDSLSWKATAFQPTALPKLRFSSSQRSWKSQERNHALTSTCSWLLPIPWVIVGQVPPPLPCGLTSPLPLFFLQGHQLLDYPLLFLSVQHHVSMGSFLFLPDSLSSPIFKTALRPTPLCSFPWSCSLYTGFLRIPRPSKSSTHNSLTSSSSHSMLNKYTKQLLLGSWLTFVSTQPRGLFVVLFLGP